MKGLPGRWWRRRENNAKVAFRDIDYKMMGSNSGIL